MEVDVDGYKEIMNNFLHCSSSSLSKGVVSCCFPSNNNNNHIINIYKTNRNNNNNEMMMRRRDVAARDMVIEFGKHKGKMLGTLSSEYLRWMSKNLNTGEFEKWGNLAEDVLEDEIYADRMEWEVAERLLSGGGVMGSGSGVGVAGELKETSKRFGWDYNDKVGWSKVDFKLLGTSNGGRLPRRRRTIHEDSKPMFDNKQQLGRCNNVVVGVEREKRRERKRSREQQKKTTRVNEEYHNHNHNNKLDEEDYEKEMMNNNETAAKHENEKSFPGRQSPINKLLH